MRERSSTIMGYMRCSLCTFSDDWEALLTWDCRDVPRACRHSASTTVCMQVDLPLPVLPATMMPANRKKISTKVKVKVWLIRDEAWVKVKASKGL